jgi:hypothetical protein
LLAAAATFFIAFLSGTDDGSGMAFALATALHAGFLFWGAKIFIFRFRKSRQV